MAREYSEEVKAAVMASLMAGQSLGNAAKEFGVPKSTVAGWAKEIGTSLASARVPDAKKEQIQGLLIDLFIAKLKSQISLAEHAGDKDWLEKQDASAVAMLLGVSDDKLIRLLEKYESHGDSTGTAES